MLSSRALLGAIALTVTGLFAATSATSPTSAATVSRPAAAATDVHNVLPIFDGGDQWKFCHDYPKYAGDVDYAVGDPPRAAWATWVRTMDSCWGRKHLVHIRYNHEINGTWMPWSVKTPAQFKRDFADFKAFVKSHSKHAAALDFGLALNFGTHRYATNDYWTPAADYVAVSMYEAPYLSNWSFFDSQIIGPTWWLKWSAAHGRRLALGEWGALDTSWQGRMRIWAAAHHLLYGAYLYAPAAHPYIAYTAKPVAP